MTATVPAETCMTRLWMQHSSNVQRVTLQFLVHHCLLGLSMSLRHVLGFDVRRLLGRSA